MKDLQPADGHGVAGFILISGRYEIDPAPDDPNLANAQAYFGSDRTRYPVQSPLNYVKNAPQFPIFIAISEYDNPDLDTQGALLFAALCQRDRACPQFTRMKKHNHLSAVYQFNTPDEFFANEVLAFVERGRKLTAQQTTSFRNDRFPCALDQFGRRQVGCGQYFRDLVAADWGDFKTHFLSLLNKEWVIQRRHETPSQS